MKNFSLPILLYCLAVIAFLVVSLIVGNIPIDGMHNLLNAYITINAAIIAVAFAAMGINPTLNETISKSMFGISIVSSFSLFTCIFSYFISYNSLSTLFTNTVMFGASTILTIASIFGVILIIQQYHPIMAAKKE